MNLGEVLGIIIGVDGEAHSFGKSKEALAAQLDFSNFHDTAFKNEVLNSSWFKATGYEYDTSNTIFYNVSDMCKHGFGIMINACAKTTGGDYNLFTVDVAEDLSDGVRSYLESIYSELKKLVDSREALFYGTIRDNEGNPISAEPIYYLEEFYDKLHLARNNSSKK